MGDILRIAAVSSAIAYVRSISGRPSVPEPAVADPNAVDGAPRGPVAAANPNLGSTPAAPVPLAGTAASPGTPPPPPSHPPSLAPLPLAVVSLSAFAAGLSESGPGPDLPAAALLSTGDEVVTGQIADTNTRFLAQRLMDLDILPVGHEAVPDDERALAEAIARAAARAPLVIMSGGLGPTDGDLTRAALARVLECPLVVDEGWRAALEAMLQRRGRVMTERQARQTLRPTAARCIHNDYGTAPGLIAAIDAPGSAHGRALIVCLPGPPGELVPMFRERIEPMLRAQRRGRNVVLTRRLHVVGVPEAECSSRLAELTRRPADEREAASRVVTGMTASGGVITIRMRFAGASDPAIARRMMDDAEGIARAALGDRIVSQDDERCGPEALAHAMIASLRARGSTLSVVESCTGGLLGSLLTDVPGASAAFVGGALTYSNALKAGLGVPGRVLEQHGAVSRACAIEMALAGLARFGSDWCVSITGIAGPDGGTAEKPVGTVYIGLAGRQWAAGTNAAIARHLRVTGDRSDVRMRSATSALTALHLAMLGNTDAPLLWEVAPT